MDDSNGQQIEAVIENKFSEVLLTISRSGKIFIVSNNNQMLNKGDFITIAIKGGKPIARAIVAKNSGEQTGIKVIRVYSLQRWSQIKKGMDLDILKGDDSAFFVTKKKVEENKVEKIETEEDLFSEEELAAEEDLSGFYKDSRLIKPDNVISAGWDQFELKNDLGDDVITESHNQFNYSWAYQFADNYWVEGLYGRTLIDDLPSTGSQTLINNFTIRAKYTFKAPLYSYIMPYIGFQSYQVDSPNAGIVEDNTSTEDQEQAQKEVDLINRLKQNNIVFGATILKRLVPGWFVKADLGTDLMSLGIAIEF